MVVSDDDEGDDDGESLKMGTLARTHCIMPFYFSHFGAKMFASSKGNIQ